MTRGVVDPINLHCPTCGAYPGIECSADEMHQRRVSAARGQTEYMAACVERERASTRRHRWLTRALMFLGAFAGCMFGAAAIQLLAGNAKSGLVMLGVSAATIVVAAFVVATADCVGGGAR